MSNTYLSSDWHLYHKNIIRYCNRPFSSVEEMNEALIENHNSVVRPNDTFFHLGDFAFAGSDEIRKALKRMNGKKIFLKGNHDRASNFVGLVDDFVPDWFGKIGGMNVHMYHYPVASWNGAFHGTIHLHGHSHGSTDSTGLLRFDMGVDCFNMFPVGVEELIALVTRRKADIAEHGEKPIEATDRPAKGNNHEN